MGSTVPAQGKAMEEKYRQYSRDYAAEGGGHIDVDKFTYPIRKPTKEQAAPSSAESARLPGLAKEQIARSQGKQGELDAYKKKMEAKFKNVGPGNLRDMQSQVGEGVGTGSTNISTGARSKQILGEEENKKRSLFA